MTRDDAVLAVLQRLEADNRMMKRVGGGALAALLVGICVAAMHPQGQDPKPGEKAAIQDVVRTRRLELANAKGAVVAVLETAEEQEEPGWLTTYHDNGRRKWRAQVENNRYEGQYVGWWPNGLKAEEGTFVKGKKHGLFTTFHENGQPKTVGAYSDGLMTGIWTLWHDNGQKQGEGLYDNDKKVDAWKQWHKNGKAASTLAFKDGALEGRQQTWHANGQQLEVYECRAGDKVGEYRSWHENGQLCNEGSYDTAGKRTGEWKFWQRDGSVDEKQTGAYERDKRVK